MATLEATLVMSGVDKRYGGVQALRDAHLRISEGETLGLLATRPSW